MGYQKDESKRHMRSVRLAGMMNMAKHACQLDKACGADETVGVGGLVRLLKVMRLLRIRENDVDSIGGGEACEDSESDIACGY